jgi:drug/metabolite transporter (DMT)-like permease
MLLLKEPLCASHVLAVGFTLLGVLLLTQPRVIFGSSAGIELDDDDESHVYKKYPFLYTSTTGTIAALSAAVLTSLTYNLTRRCEGHSNTAQLLLSQSIASLLMLSVLVALQPMCVPPSASSWANIAAVSFGGFAVM